MEANYAMENEVEEPMIRRMLEQDSGWMDQRCLEIYTKYI